MFVGWMNDFLPVLEVSRLRTHPFSNLPKSAVSDVTQHFRSDIIICLGSWRLFNIQSAISSFNKYLFLRGFLCEAVCWWFLIGLFFSPCWISAEEEQRSAGWHFLRQNKPSNNRRPWTAELVFSRLISPRSFNNCQSWGGLWRPFESSSNLETVVFTEQPLQAEQGLWTLCFRCSDLAEFSSDKKPKL